MKKQFTNFIGFIQKKSLDYLDICKSGNLKSIHNKGVYFLLGNELYLIHDFQYGLIPFGIAIKRKINFKEIGLKPNMIVCYSNLNLSIPESNLVITLENNNEFGKKDAYQGMENFPNLPIDINVIDKNIDYVFKNILPKSISGNGLGPLFKNIDNLFNDKKREEYCVFNKYWKYFFDYLFLFVNSIISKDFKKIKNSLSFLVGLGTGLTPLMDDILLGIISSLFYLKKHFPDELKFVSKVGVLLNSESKGRTTIFSEMYLKHASRGETFDIVNETTHIIMLITDKLIIKKKINLILSIGNNSGKGILLGIIISY